MYTSSVLIYLSLKQNASDIFAVYNDYVILATIIVFKSTSNHSAGTQRFIYTHNFLL